ncbi:hypothetical protein GCM10010320_49750 [Streptomyces caelestis]|nr:hypothetical protein GCM10010320_49750 [Streptomyces caelestis]
MQRVAVLPDLRPQVQETLPGLLPVPGVVQHDDLPDPRRHGIRRRLSLSLHDHALRTARPLFLPDANRRPGGSG